MIHTTHYSIGKTDRRNDDIVFERQIFGHTALGVIGDFTSDSPPGANTACGQHLAGFVDERLAVWREMQLPADRILPLIVRQVNTWLKQYGNAKTTLIAFMWQQQEDTLHYINIGDSGLAILDAQGLRYLAEGDRGGARIAAGFLPGDVPQTVQSTRCEAGATVFAFTDGLWENTTGFMDDALLARVLLGENNESIMAQLKQQIIDRAARKDDLTVLLMKGAPASQNETGPLGGDPALQQEIQQALQGAPLEQELLTPPERQLGQLLAEIPALETRLLQQLETRLEHRDQQDEIEKLRRQIQTLARKIEAQDQRIAELEQVEPSPKNRPEKQTPKHRQKEHEPPPAKTNKPSVATKQTRPKNDLLFMILAGVAIGIVLFLGMAWLWPDKKQAEPVQQEVATAQDETSQPTETTAPEAGPLSPALLGLLGVDLPTYQRHVRAIASAIAQAEKPIPVGTHEAIFLEKCDDLNNGVLNLVVDKGTTWAQSGKPGRGVLAALWLQTQLGTTANGTFGKAETEAFLKRYGAAMKQRARAAQLMAASDATGLDDALLAAFGKAGKPYAKADYDKERGAIAEVVAAASVDKPSIELSLMMGQELRALRIPIAGTHWAERIREKKIDAATVRPLWLAMRLGMKDYDRKELDARFAPWGDEPETWLNQTTELQVSQ